jgi:hypothetical protein
LFADADIRSLYTYLRDLPYQLNDVASDETSYVKHWKADFPPAPALAEGTPLLRECIRTARALRPAISTCSIAATRTRAARSEC